MQFPQYRKYKNFKTCFKIISEREFEEWSMVGRRLFHHKIVAAQYPEMIRIQDMLRNEGDRWEILSENEFKEHLKGLQTLSS